VASVNDLELAGLRDQLAPFNPVAIASGIAALQLCPANADHLVRLEVLADLASSLQLEGQAAEMSRRRWNQVVNGAPLVSSGIPQLEDWLDAEFVSELAFFGGGYSVLPGLTEDAVFVSRLLLRALHVHSRPSVDPDFVLVASRLVHAALVVSDTMAKQAGLVRGTPAVHRGDRAVVVPTRRSPAAGKTFAVRHVERKRNWRCADGSTWLIGGRPSRPRGD